MNYLKSKLASKSRLPISQISGSHCKNAGTYVACMYVSSHDNKTNEATVYAHEFAMGLNLPPKKIEKLSFCRITFFIKLRCAMFITLVNPLIT